MDIPCLGDESIQLAVLHNPPFGRRQPPEALQRLPADAQNTIATRILEEIEEREWDAIISKPRVQARLRELGRQAREEDRAGETEDGGFDCL